MFAGRTVEAVEVIFHFNYKVIKCSKNCLVKVMEKERIFFSFFYKAQQNSKIILIKINEIRRRKRR